MASETSTATLRRPTPPSVIRPDGSFDVDLFARAYHGLNAHELKADLAFFRMSPDRSFRLRPSSLIETVEAKAPFVLAVKTGPDSRHRCGVHLPDWIDLEDFDTEEYCRELFEHIQGVVGGVN